MAIFGHERDISFFRHISRELLSRIIETKIGYYKIDLERTKDDVYGEAEQKFYYDPVLIDCLIERGDDLFIDKNGTVDYTKPASFRFLRDILAEMNIVPEIGDILLWNDNYFEADNVNENQLIGGKDPLYSYASHTDSFGASWSITLRCHHTNPGRLGISQVRL